NERPGRGLHGYARSFEFQHGRTLFAIGGQRETAFISMSGDGCALVQDWPALVALLRDRLDGRITRWDGATDDYEGRRSVDSAVEAYRAGGFNGRGRKPSCSVDGDWIDPQGKGRTFYVGNRENGKLLRVYEKGKQLGEAQSPWVRWEVELHNVDRVIPWEVLLEPGRYLAGAYPALTWVQEEASRIATLKKADGITYDRAVHYAKQSIGRLVNVMVEREGSPEGVVEELRRDGVPKRLELTERLGLRGEKKKK
ncbi:MAG TPA: replication initiation factor domain-containing protein, partial [Steroidobacteraceae bacterium]